MPGPDLDERLRHTVARQLRIPADDLTVDKDLISLGLSDDRTALGVLEAVEDLLDVRLPDDFLDGVQTFGEFRSAVRVALPG
jgi:acyl carrier protein